MTQHPTFTPLQGDESLAFFRAQNYVVLADALSTNDSDFLNAFVDRSEEQIPGEWGIGSANIYSHGQILVNHPELDPFTRPATTFPLVAAILGPAGIAVFYNIGIYHTRVLRPARCGTPHSAPVFQPRVQPTADQLGPGAQTPRRAPQPGDSRLLQPVDRPDARIRHSGFRTRILHRTRRHQENLNMGDCGDPTDKDGKVRIAWGGQTVVTLKGAKARTVLARADGADAEALQLLLARMAGNFNRSNKRAAARKGR